MTDPAENRDVRGNTIKPHSVDAENVDTKNATVETEPTSDNEIARKVDIDAKADLNTDTGVLKSSQVPDLAITSVTTVQDKSARLSLNVEEGDVAIQTDTDTTYIFTGGDPSNDADWSEIELDVIDAIQGSSISPDTVNANSVSTDSLSLGPVLSATSTFSGGQTKVLGLNASLDSSDLGQGLIVHVGPENDPGNDHGYTLDSVFWDNSDSRIKIRISETESAGGGQVRYVVWKLGQ